MPVPFGQHCYVVSDFELRPSTNPATRAVRELVKLLHDLDDPATVIVAGNLFGQSANGDQLGFVAQTLEHLGELTGAVEDFLANETHRLILLGGSHDNALLENDAVANELTRRRIEIASEVMLQVATLEEARELLVTTGTYGSEVERVDARWRPSARCLEDPSALMRFAGSRTLYRRWAAWLWLPLLAVIVGDLWTSLASVLGHFTHHDYDVRRLHPSGFWHNLFYDAVLVVVTESLLATLAGWAVRQRFDRETRRHRAPEVAEPLTLTKTDGVDAVEVARRVVERGGVGAVIGGSPRPALAFLDRGVVATPGPSRHVVVEMTGRFGLPPVFRDVERWGLVEIEAAASVRVRLESGEDRSPKSPVVERIVERDVVQPAPQRATTTLGAWPSGDPFPLQHERLSAQRHQRLIRRWGAGLVLLNGLVNVAVSVIHPLRAHLRAVEAIFPLGVAESAATVTALAGIAMVMLARSLRRGQHRAWQIAVLIEMITAVSHFLRGGRVITVVAAAAILAFLIVQRQHFQATTDRTSVRAALPQVIALPLVATAAAWLGIEAAARQHLPRPGVVLVAVLERLVGVNSINLNDRANDFVRAPLLAVGVTTIVSGLYLITRPVVDRRLSTSARTSERRLAEFRAREIVRRHGRGTLDYFALRDDKQFFFFRDSLVAYAVYGGVALISPDPIGPVAERTECFSAFRTFAEARGWTIGVMGAAEEWLPIYRAAGLHYLYTGDEAIVDCSSFTLEGGRMKGLRQACTRLERNGYTVEFHDPATIDPTMVSDIVELITKLRRGDAERGFSMMLGRLFNPKDKGLLLTVVRDQSGHPVAVCQFVPSPSIKGYSLDLMRRDPGDHPNGLIDYALCSTIAHLRAQGVRGLSLNFAVFRSVLDGEKGEGTVTRMERWALKRLSGILPIETLWSFNAKYYPTWFPRHLVYPAAESFVPVVAAVLRAESITELPVFGRLLVHDPSNRPGTVVPTEVLAAAKRADEARGR